MIQSPQKPVIPASKYMQDGKGYMTPDAILTQRGLILAESEQVEAQLLHSRTNARRIASNLQLMANRLKTDPEKFVLPNEETQGCFQANDEMDTTSLDLGAILEVRNSIRTLLERQKELNQQRG